MKVRYVNGSGKLRARLCESEEPISVSVGDVVRLKPSFLKKSLARYLANTGHRFVVLDIMEDGKLKVATITSQLDTLHKFSYYEFADWEKEGFTKPCGANLQSIGYISPDCVHKRIGSLSSNDLDGIIFKDTEDRKILQKLENMSLRGRRCI